MAQPLSAVNSVALAEETQRYLQEQAGLIVSKNLRKIQDEDIANCLLYSLGKSYQPEVKVHKFMVQRAPNGPIKPQEAANYKPVPVIIRPSEFKKVPNLHVHLAKFDPFKLNAFNFLRDAVVSKIEDNRNDCTLVIIRILMCEDNFNEAWLQSAQARHAALVNSELIRSEAAAVASKIAPPAKKSQL